MSEMTLGSLHIPSLVSDDRQYTSVQSPYIIPSMTKVGAGGNLGSPLSDFNPTLDVSGWFGSEDKEKTTEPEPEKQASGINYKSYIIFGLFGLGLLLIMRGKGV